MNVNDSPLKALLESTVLNEETKTVVKEAIDTAIAAKEVQLQEAFDVKLVEKVEELNEQYKTVVQEAVAEELEALSEEIKHARTLEVRYADRLEQFKEDYKKTTDETISTLVAESLKTEMDELKEDIEIAKKHEFVMRMFESYRETYERLFGGAETTVVDQLKEATAELEGIKREQKISELVESLTDRKKNVAKTILENVALDKLEERFESILPMLIEQEEKKEEEKEDKDGEKEEKKVDEEKKSGKAVVEDEDGEGEKEKDEKHKKISEALEKSLKFARRV